MNHVFESPCRIGTGGNGPGHEKCRVVESPEPPFPFTKFRELREHSTLGLRLRCGMLKIRSRCLKVRRTVSSNPFLFLEDPRTTTYKHHAQVFVLKNALQNALQHAHPNIPALQPYEFTLGSQLHPGSLSECQKRLVSESNCHALSQQCHWYNQWYSRNCTYFLPVGKEYHSSQIWDFERGVRKPIAWLSSR